MLQTRIQSVLSHLDKKLHRFIDIVGEVPYVALPPERPYIICFSAKIKEVCGYDADDILINRQLWIDMVHPDDWGRVDAAFTQCKNEGIPFDIEYRLVHKDGSLRYVSDKGEPVFSHKGETIQIEGVITPIGESKKPGGIPLLEIRKVTEFNDVNSNHFQKA